jgi:phosphoglycerate dehydrogenase-like enzyme
VADRLTVALAMRPDVATYFDGPLGERLRALVHVDTAAVLADYDGAAGRAALADADVLLTGWNAPVLTAAALAAAPRLRAVVHAAGTVKGLLSPEAWRAGLLVSSAAEANAWPVAEYTLAAVLLAGKRLPRIVRDYARTGQRFFPAPPTTGNNGRTVGVVGASKVGRLVLELLRRHDIRPLLTDPYVSAAEAAALGAEHVDLDTLVATSDVVTLHAPSLPETRHLIDARRLAAMRDGAVLINTARGALVDTDALVAECATGRLSAVLDVTDPEPLPVGHPLFTLDTVLVTPHLAGAQGNEIERLCAFAVDEIDRLVNGQPLRGLVRPDDLPRIA